MSHTASDTEEDDYDDYDYDDDYADVEEGLFRRIYARQEKRQKEPSKPGGASPHGKTAQRPGRATPSDEDVQRRQVEDANKQSKALAAAIETASAAVSLLEAQLSGIVADGTGAKKAGVREARRVVGAFPPPSCAKDPAAALKAFGTAIRDMRSITQAAL